MPEASATLTVPVARAGAEPLPPGVRPLRPVDLGLVRPRLPPEEIRRLPIHVAVTITAAWMVLCPVVVNAEPPPTPGVELPAWLFLVNGIAAMAATTTFAGLWGLWRSVPTISLLASTLALVTSAAGPFLGEHEEVGSWWIYQVAALLGLVAISVWGLRRRSAG